DVTGAFTGGHNLVGNGTGEPGIVNNASGNRVGTNAHPIDPLVGPLATNGGPTGTLALLTGSPAIGHGDPATCSGAAVAGIDQRGIARPTSLCAIGAYEPLLSAVSPATGGT